MEEYKLNNGNTIKAESADGVEGFLLTGPFGKMWFRVYDENHKFRDYRIYHHDIRIKIIDSGVYFYYTNDGKKYLDYCPGALGYKDEKKKI